MAFVQRLGKKTANQVDLIEGNHDIIPAWKFEQLGIQINLISEKTFTFPFPYQKKNFVFCGHVHPGVKFKSWASTTKMPCFFQSQIN